VQVADAFESQLDL